MAAVDWRPAYGGMGAPHLDDHLTTQEFPLGMVIPAQSTADGGGEFIYLKGVSGTAVGSWVTYNRDDHSTALLVRDAKGPVAIAMSACVANEYGWYQTSGKSYGLSNDAADNADVYSSTSPGTIDDAVSTGNRVWRAKTASADDTSTGLIEVEIDRPFVEDGVGGGST